MVTVACLGDSITYGEGCSLGLGWAGRLNRILQQSEPHQHGVYNLGICGDTVAGAYHRYHSEVLLRRPAIVIIGIGTNDCQRSGDDKPVHLRSGLPRVMEQWDLWHKRLSLGFHKTLILGTLAVDETPMPYIHDGEPNNWVLNDDLKRYNDLLAAFCADHKLPFVDFWQSWSPDTAKTHTVDGLHPNDAGYDLMFDIILSALKQHEILL